ncbi:ATPase [Actinomadura sp. 6N118]|uniref:RapZ C-terminal domain-containing protein n=1 Tax=Actinomadura sp. 6N118 TaxID=3375151 RepID=UPI0037B5EE75
MQHEVHLHTFGYLHGAPPPGHITIDLRSHFRDPHISPELRHLTAHDEPVRAAVLATPGIPVLTEALTVMVLAYLAGPSAGPVTVAVGCQGGRHRAPTVGAQAAQTLAAGGVPVTLIHRDLERPVVDRATSAEMSERGAGMLRAALGKDGPKFGPRGWSER